MADLLTLGTSVEFDSDGENLIGTVQDYVEDGKDNPGGIVYEVQVGDRFMEVWEGRIKVVTAADHLLKSGLSEEEQKTALYLSKEVRGYDLESAISYVKKSALCPDCGARALVKTEVTNPALGLDYHKTCGACGFYVDSDDEAKGE